MSSDYYNQNAQLFFSETFDVDMSNIYRRFTKGLIQGGRILDMGCGSGRDAVYFHNRGFKVDAFDASLEMVKLAAQTTGLDIKHDTFQNYATAHSFDGLWACASLLHLPKTAHEEIITKFYKTLNSGGIFYMSFKYGTNDYDKNGRHFSCHNEESICDVLGNFLDNAERDIWLSKDARKNRQSEKWLNVLLKKND